MKDAADGESPDVFAPVIDILFPCVDQEAHGAVALEISVFFRSREGDHVELPARDVGYIGHERTVRFSSGDGGQHADILAFDQSFDRFEHRRAPPFFDQ